MFIDTAIATLMYKGVTNPALKPATITFIEKINQVNKNSNGAFDTIEQLILNVVKPFYEQKSDLVRIGKILNDEQSKNNGSDYTKVLLSKTKLIKNNIIENANDFLNFIFVNISKNPVKGQNLVSLLDLLDIDNVELDVKVYSKSFEHNLPRTVTMGDLIFDCCGTKDLYKNELKAEGVLKETEQEINANTKFESDFTNFMFASRCR